jgi:hypothetical protein
MKTDYAIVFGNPDTSYFLHFQKLSTYYLLSMIDVSTGSLINQTYYTQTTDRAGGIMDEAVISGVQYIATISHSSSNAFFMMTAISGSTMTPRSFVL